MRYYFAPMEGLTGSLFRKVHHAIFPGADRYYTPFISPTAEHVFTAREQREIVPDIARGIPLVPQLLTKNARDFLWAARSLRELGYEEVNLNLGCPSRTVTAKGKGSAMLGDPDALEVFLDEVFAGAEGLRISVKTRIGVRDAAEFDRLLRIYGQYPICELIIHPRTAGEMYRGLAHREVFADAMEKTSLPLCYNGDIAVPEDTAGAAKQFPGLEAVMIGRGAVTNPALFRQLRGGPGLTKAELHAFHDALYAGYREQFDDRIAMKKMKELWAYLLFSFTGREAYIRPLRKASRLEEYEAVVQRLFLEQDVIPGGAFDPNNL